MSFKGTVVRMNSKAHADIAAARKRMRERLLTPQVIIHPAYAKRIVGEYQAELFSIIAREKT